METRPFVYLAAAYLLTALLVTNKRALNTLLWAFVNLANAALTMWLLLTQSVSVYVAARTGVSVVFTGAAIALSTFWFKRSMREHNILVAQ